MFVLEKLVRLAMQHRSRETVAVCTDSRCVFRFTAQQLRLPSVCSEVISKLLASPNLIASQYALVGELQTLGTEGFSV